MTTTTDLTTRNADLADLASLLQDQHARKVDMVVPADQIRSRGANLVIAGAGGVVNAITSYAQTVENADDAMEIESQALNALDLAVGTAL